MNRTAPLRRSPLKQVSAKRRKEAAIYARKRGAFLEKHPFCQVWMGVVGFEEGFVLEHPEYVPAPRSCDIHHKAGRRGKNYLDESTWMAVSREGHQWIHDHPKQARARGWLV